MKHEIETTAIHRVTIDLSDQPVVGSWPGFSHRGKPMQPVKAVFAVKVTSAGADVDRLRVVGQLIKADGTLSAVTASEADIWSGWVEDTDGGTFYEHEQRELGHIIEHARGIARELLAEVGER